MAEDQEKIEPSGPAPGPEVPYEERFLSSEKQYPTKEERDKAIEEARRPKPELPHVPPFIETQSSKPNWQPVPETEPAPPAQEHLEAKGGAKFLKTALKTEEEQKAALQRESERRFAARMEKYRERQRREPYRVPPETDFPPPSLKKQDVRTQARLNPIRPQETQRVAPQSIREPFLSRVWNKLRGRG